MPKPRYIMPPHPLTLEQAIAREEGWYLNTVTRCQRNRNPGNIVYGMFAQHHGATGSDGRFAIFASADDGFAALNALLNGPEYAHLTIEECIRKYAPSSENDTEVYINNVCHWTGYTRQHVLNTFLTTPPERA